MSDTSVESTESEAARVLLICPRGSVWDTVLAERTQRAPFPHALHDIHFAAHLLAGLPLHAIFLALGENEQHWNDFIPFFRSRQFRAPVFFLLDDRAETAQKIVEMCDEVILVSEFSALTMGKLPLCTVETGPESFPRLPTSKSTTKRGTETGMTCREARSESEARLIESTLHQHHGHVSNTAKALGITRRGLQYKLRAYGIDVSLIRLQDGEQRHNAHQEQKESIPDRFRGRRSSVPLGSDLSNPS